MEWKKHYDSNRRTIRRLVAVLLGLLVAFFALFYCFYGGLFLNIVLTNMISSSSESITPRHVYDIITNVVVFGYSLLVGLCFSYAFWDGLPSEPKRTILYLVIFLAIGPLTLANYSAADQIIDVDVQFCFNLFTVFVAYIAVRRVLAIRPSSFDGAALQSIILLIFSAVLIVLPLLFSAVYVMVKIGLIEREDARAIGAEYALGIPGLMALLPCLLNFRSYLRSIQRPDIGGDDEPRYGGGGKQP